jgi:hypothetical protein
VNGKDFRYIISGAQKDGSVYAVNAQVYKKANNPNGDMVICPVSEHTGGRITGNATGQSDDRTNALPNTFDGRWQNVSTNQNGMEVFDTIWLSPYSFNFQGIEQLDQGAGGKITMKMQEFAILPLEVTRKNDVSYDIIVANRTVDSWLSTDQKNAVAQLFADYLTEKGITATRVSDEQSSSGFSSNTTSKEYSIHGNGNIYCNNFSVDFDWFRHISEWRNDNIQPRYIKCNLAIVNGNKLNLSFYLNGNNAESYLTLQEAKNSTTATPYKQFTRK